ncbi:hypothetical protein HYC85_010448 [Camellia sinensis]|uniref:NAD(P)H dehydrogenase (quinone) n=1 Tax=Camellia sinensis TaxID=4442 RepID=A0A7J7HKJ4_CAMSI|nr:hypothetical protein HYC85_010448 [Camellia sinensis]
MEAVVATKPVITVAALCGSLRKGSFNRGLLRSAIQICNESINGIKIEYIEIAPLPMLNTDLEVNGTFPPVVEAFRQKIREVDSVLFASPEYNYSVTGRWSEASWSYENDRSGRFDFIVGRHASDQGSRKSQTSHDRRKCCVGSCRPRQRRR